MPTQAEIATEELKLRQVNRKEFKAQLEKIGQNLEQFRQWRSQPTTVELVELFRLKLNSLNSKLKNAKCKNQQDYLATCMALDFYSIFDDFIKRYEGTKDSIAAQLKRMGVE